MPWNTDDNRRLLKPINTADVSRALNKGSLDTGTLCTSNTLINKWAKFKPYTNGSVKTVETDRLNANCGMTIPSHNSIGNIVNTGVAIEVGKDDGWVYTAVTGKYRLFDFVDCTENATTQYGYWKDAHCCWTPFVPKQWSNKSIPTAVTLEGMFDNVNPEIVKLTDIHDSAGNATGAWYRGVAFSERGASPAKIFACTLDKYDPSYIQTNFLTKTYDVVFFLSQNSFAFSNAEQSGNRYVLAPIPHFEMSYVRDETITLTISSVSVNGTVLSFKVKASQQVSSSSSYVTVTVGRGAEYIRYISLPTVGTSDTTVTVDFGYDLTGFMGGTLTLVRAGYPDVVGLIVAPVASK